LWNVFHLFIIRPLAERWQFQGGQSRIGANADLLIPIWIHFFKAAIDSLPINASSALDWLRQWFFDEAATPWNKVYDFIQFVANLRQDTSGFIRNCNIMMEREFSGYRFVGTTIAPITNEAEIRAIEQAASVDNSVLRPVTTHIQAAMHLLSDRENPDYRNSMKESISAVEAVCKIIAPACARWDQPSTW